jgi:signal transduction histidine kinase
MIDYSEQLDGSGMGRRSGAFRLVLVLGFVFAGIVIWQAYEHVRMVEWARAGLRNRTRDITNSLGIILRSQSRFGFISQGRLEAALEDMVESQEVRGVAVLNQSGEPTAQAGKVDPSSAQLTEKGERWDPDTVTFVNLVDLGMAWHMQDPGASSPIILPRRKELEPGAHPGSLHSPEAFSPMPGQPAGPGEPRPPGPPAPSDSPPAPGSRWELFDEAEREQLNGLMDGRTLSAADVDRIIAMLPGGFFDERQHKTFQAELAGASLDEEKLRAAMMAAFRARKDPLPANRGPLFRRPPWLSQEQYDELRRTYSAHWFVLTLSNRMYKEQVFKDLWLRMLVMSAGLFAVGAVGLAWRAIERSSHLRIRLIRATDLNAHLREMNVAAAGLVHETKNPLNVVRGLAQMISRNEQAPDELRNSALQITEEVDRVTGRLNQFIDYSRPLEVKLAPTNLGELFESVRRVLESDFAEKNVAFNVSGPSLMIEADESLLRQVVFNLLLNALQAVGYGGFVAVTISKEGQRFAAFEVRDNGPGVPPEAREEVFRPYFTLNAKGTGLGLAIVRQIVLAHQWEVVCESSLEGGAVFRVTGLRIVSPAH